MNYSKLKFYWSKIDARFQRSIVVRVLDKERVKCLRAAAGEEALATDVNSLIDAKARELHATCAQGLRELATHYQQAIDLLTAAPMPASEEGK